MSETAAVPVCAMCSSQMFTDGREQLKPLRCVQGCHLAPEKRADFAKAFLTWRQTQKKDSEATG